MSRMIEKIRTEIGSACLIENSHYRNEKKSHLMTKKIRNLFT